MAKTFPFEIVTPEKIVFSEEVTALVVPAHEGYLGVLAGHAPLLCTLQPGEVKVESASGNRFFATSGGFLEVSAKKTILLSEAVEPAAGIDLARAEKALARARERLQGAKPGIDRTRAEASLERAQNRARVSRKHPS